MLGDTPQTGLPQGGDEWYYVTASREQAGPVTAAEIRHLVAQGVVKAETLIWAPGWEQWQPAGQVPAFRGEDPTRLSPIPVEVPAAEAPPPADAMHLKPVANLFMLSRLMPPLLVLVLFCVFLAVNLAGFDQSPWIALAVLLGGAFLPVVSARVAFRKEQYEVHDHRIVCRRGGIFGDETSELELRNVTHIKLKLPWLRHKFFGVGHVMIESAGVAKPIVIQSIRDPQSLYEELWQRLRKNGFSLSRAQLLHEEKPVLIGVVLETLGLFVGVGFAMLYILFLIPAVREMKSDEAGYVLVFAIPLLVLLVLVGFSTLRFLDLMRRTYRVYNDAVVYEEGFLTRENAFIPFENIADAKSQQTVIDRIFGIFDVHISCQGSSAEIRFRRLRRGEALSAAIGRLVVSAVGKPRWKPSKPESSAAAALPRRKEMEPLVCDPTLTREFKMHAARLLVPLLLLLPLFPLWVAAMISAVIRLYCTRYGLRAGALHHHFAFLSKQAREFACEKVTGVVVKRNLWDLAFGTMSVKFWSIGSSEAMEFLHIDVASADLPVLLRQVGIPPATAEPYQARVRFAFGPWLRARLNLLPILIMVLAFGGVAYWVDPVLTWLLLAPGLAIAVAVVHAHLYYNRETLSFHEHHVEAVHGIITKRHFYACYRNIKRTKATRYPGGREGALQIFIAGEETSKWVAQQQKQQQKNQNLQGLKVQCSFNTGMLADVGETAAVLNDILSGRIDPGPGVLPAGPLELLFESRRAVMNSVVLSLLLSIVVFPLLVLLPFTLTWIVISIKRWRYRIDHARVVVSRGVFYAVEEVVLLDRVDRRQHNQGAIHKLCRNGDVTLMTAGSSRADLFIRDCPDYIRFYELVREYSQ